MSILAIVLTVFLEQKNLLVDVRRWFNKQLVRYVDFFINRQITNQREIRYIYLIACLPVALTLLVLGLILRHNFLLFGIFKLAIFILSIQILTWKDEAKQNKTDYSYIDNYAINFFSTLFWFLVLPAAIGSTCYLIIIAISKKLKNQESDSLVYNVTVDKILFYTNVIPFTLLYFFVAIAGNFEDVMHYLLSQRKQITKSFFFLQNILHEVILIAIGKEKFQLSPASLNHAETTETNLLNKEQLSPKINAYIIAILYRAGIFFIGLIAIISIANIIR